MPALDGRLSDLSGGYLDVLFVQGPDYVRSSQTAACHAHRIQPHAHGIFALSKDENVGHAGHAFQRVLDVHVQVIAHEERIIPAVLRIDGSAENEIVRSFGNADAGSFDCARKTSLGGVDAVLDVD